MSAAWSKFAATLALSATALRSMPFLSPAEFAAKHRKLHEMYCSERPGPWDSSVFPYQDQMMNMVEEATRTGKRGVVYLKSGQGGGTDLAINGQLWLKVYFPGPQLFMTSTEKVANEFGRERFGNIIPDMAPLAATYLPNKRGDILTKRFADGKIQLAGGQSVFNLQSTPYRVVVIDELDSLVDNLGGQGDPLNLAEVRTDSFSGPTLIIAYAHPTTRERGAGKLFYENSDQRRGFVKHSCGHEFHLQWEHVKPGQDRTDPQGYEYACPGCGSVVSDAERVAMVRKVEYRSVLPPDLAAKKDWIGAHFSQLYYPAKTIVSLAKRWIACGDDENKKRVFYNKVLGEPYDLKVQEVDAASLRALIVVKRRANDPEFYIRGQVPPGVRFLTAGQDSRAVELHYAVWGWGLRRAVDKTLHLCGWLIDWGRINRERSLEFHEAEYHVFDDLIYRQNYPSSVSDRTYNVMQCGHDIGYPPTQIPVIRYARSWPQRAIPVKGASLTATSASVAPYARWGEGRKYRAGETEVKDDNSRALLLNTFMLKTDLYGMMRPDRKIEVQDVAAGEGIGLRKVARICLPEDVDDEWINESANEALVAGKKTNELVWAKTGPNHYADCNTYALGCAYNIDPFQKGKTAEEYQQRRGYIRPRGSSGRSHDDPALG
jgi:phage terminase large subunit GpA-like protein